MFSKPLPRARICLSQGCVTFVAQRHANLRDAKPENIVYPAVLADIPAAFASDSVAWLHCGAYCEMTIAAVRVSGMVTEETKLVSGGNL